MCDYCGCRSIDVIGRFSAEHEGIVNALGAVVRACADEDAAATRRTATHLAELLGPHTGAEERGLFAELRQDPDFTDHIDQLCGEHTSLDDMVLSVAGGAYELAPLLERALRRHIDREENGLFPAAAIALDGPAWERVTEVTEGTPDHEHPHSHDGAHEHPHSHDGAYGHSRRAGPAGAVA